ncbi:MAG: 4-hydroxy-tetrahydrodipicolinate reductase [Ketobacteraceae bacterium]|nr:4-hydroxy-tetrahydrodipicolinate reductase [Ketobacteraceae bacterium]
MVKVIVNGAKGKMGSEAVKAIKEYDGLELVAESDVGDDLGKMVLDSGADVVVDLTVASSAYENTATIIQAGARPVIGTSGLDDKQVAKLVDLAKAKGVGGVIAPNFSIGALLMIKFAKEAAKYFDNVEVIEYHHAEKADFPSGTAVRTAEILSREIHSDDRPCVDLPHAPCVSGIPVHSVRMNGVLARQQVLFGSKGQTLTIDHNSVDRSCFMNGICLACIKAPSLKELYYGLEHILD